MNWSLHIWQLCLFAKVAGWAELDLSVSEWAAIIVGVVCLWILISVVLACFCGPDFVTCHLCQQQGRSHIPKVTWCRLRDYRILANGEYSAQ